MNRTRTGFAAVLLAASVSLTACGGSSADKASDNTSSTQASASASAATSNADYEPLTKAGWATALQQATKKSKDSHIDMKMGSMLSAVGDISLESGKPAMKMTMKITNQGKTLTMEERLVGGTIYISAPGMLPDGKWMKVDSDMPGMGKIAGMMKNFDPASMAAMSKQSIDSLTYVGETEIDGDSVHEYKLTVDVAKAAGKLGLATLLKKSNSASLPSSITEKVYLNADNTLRRISGEIAGQTLQVDRVDAAAPVKVSAPPASDVVDMSSMMSQLGSGSGSAG